ncbi:amidohydrolase family protein [Leifsonia sp. NPDC058230]|uniref:amidohydrolase family protein n=1 Tax=Leifsonia sp. NPDC058230 TaxID=3346391 RepID=UPI0036DB1F90
MLVDAQVHAGPDRYGPIEDYLPTLKAAGVDAAVLVQQSGSVDNRYLAELVAQRPDRFAGVGGVDVSAGRADAQVRRVREAGLTGVRLPAAVRGLDGEPDVWREIAEAGLVATVQGPYEDVADPDFRRLVADLPGMRVVLEHVGNHRYRPDGLPDALLRLAELENVHVMLSCYYRFSSERYPFADSAATVAAVIDAFGPERLLWSGDLNRADQGLAEADDDYPQAIALIRCQLGGLTAAERALVLSGNAARLYRIALP